jgi:CheY-like chemotaxis protein
MQTNLDTLAELPSLSGLRIVKRGIVLLDDDPLFCELFVAVGKSLGLHIQSFRSLAQLPSIRHLNEYDLAIFDYHLENFTGTEIAEYANDFFPMLPVFLISADENAKMDNRWPLSILGFCNKSMGPYKILHKALFELIRVNLYKELRR